MGKMLGWVHDHPWVVVSFLSGTFVGALIALPLVPYSLPDSTANLIGAALGAGIAVWGAAWVSAAHARKAQTTALEVIKRISQTYLKAIGGFVRAVESDATPDLIQMTAAEVTVELDGFRRRVTSLESAMLQIGPVGLLAHADLSEILQHAADDKTKMEHLVTDEALDEKERRAGLKSVAEDLGLSGQAVIAVVHRLNRDLHGL